MRKPSIVSGILLALGLTALAYLGALSLGLFLGGVFLSKIIIGGVVWLYLLYLLRLSKEKTGRLTLGLGTGMILAIAALSGLSASYFVILAIGLIWIVRCFYAYASLVMALADAAICALALGLSILSFTKTGSIYAALWVFFLTQALFTLIPEKISGVKAQPASPQQVDSFSQAHQNAEAALKALLRGVG